MNNPLVSIIIPTYNRAHLIGETLDSVLAQTYENWECIIVDDGSTDNSEEVIGNYVRNDSRFQYHKRPEDMIKGGNSCRNYGFDLCNGNYINWFDDDDIMHPEKLQKQVSALENTNFSYVVCLTLLFDDKIENGINLLRESNFSSNPFEDFLKCKIAWLTQAPMFKKSFLLEMSKLFDEELLAAQEWEFFCRILFYDQKYAIIDEVLVYNRQHLGRLGTNKKFENKKLYHYYYARIKIELFLTENKNEYYDFFTQYYIQIFRLLILNRNKEFSKQIFNDAIKGRVSLLKYVKLKLVSCFYLFGGRGYTIVKNLIN